MLGLERLGPDSQERSGRQGMLAVWMGMEVLEWRGPEMQGRDCKGTEALDGLGVDVRGRVRNAMERQDWKRRVWIGVVGIRLDATGEVWRGEAGQECIARESIE